MNPFDMSTQQVLLSSTLGVAVPLWFAELRNLRAALNDIDFGRELRTRADRCSQIVAEHGDVLMFKIPGKSAKAFNALAEGIACLAFCPGGVKAFGTRYRVDGSELVTESEPDREPAAVESAKPDEMFSGLSEFRFPGE